MLLMPAKGAAEPHGSRRSRLVRVQGPVMCLSQARGRFHLGTPDGAAATDWIRGGSMAPLGEVMLFTAADCQRFGWQAG